MRETRKCVMMDGVAPDNCVYASGLLAREATWCGGGVWLYRIKHEWVGEDIVRN
jgi:hypothetical protein